MEKIEAGLLVLDRCIEDCLTSWGSKKVPSITLSADDMRSLLKDYKEQMEKALRGKFNFKIYMRQLLLKSVRETPDKTAIKDMLRETKSHMLYSCEKEKDVRSLWGTVWLEFLSEIDDLALLEIFTGSTFHDEYLAQVAYEEYKRRKDPVNSFQPKKSSWGGGGGKTTFP
jgi:hypothetical protein